MFLSSGSQFDQKRIPQKSSMVNSSKKRNRGTAAVPQFFTVFPQGEPSYAVFLRFLPIPVIILRKKIISRPQQWKL
jgi:hypothetical protein